jgi:hypothetical protein
VRKVLAEVIYEMVSEARIPTEVPTDALVGLRELARILSSVCDVLEAADGTVPPAALERLQPVVDQIRRVPEMIRQPAAVWLRRLMKGNVL